MPPIDQDFVLIIVFLSVIFYVNAGVFSLGAFITLILVRTGQLVIGQPKPHYFNICDGPTECTDTLSVVQLTCAEEGVRLLIL